MEKVRIVPAARDEFSLRILQRTCRLDRGKGLLALRHPEADRPLVVFSCAVVVDEAAAHRVLAPCVRDTEHKTGSVALDY